MSLDGFVVEITIPGNISHADMASLQKCEGRVFFLNTLRRRAELSEVDYSSYFVNGATPDTMTILSEYRRRFAAVITRVIPGKITAAALGVGGIPPGLAIQNTGPFDLRNGDAVSFFPPVLGQQPMRLKLDSIAVELIFPLTIPTELVREITAKLVAKAIETVSRNAGAQQRSSTRDSDVIYYNGKRFRLTPTIQHLESTESVIRTLILNMLFTINEGCMLLFALIPNLLTLGAQDGYANALIQLESATRAVGQLIRMPQVPQVQDGERRFPVYDALSNWMNMATRLGDELCARPMLRVCTFDGPSTIGVGEFAVVIANWF